MLRSQRLWLCLGMGVVIEVKNNENIFVSKFVCYVNIVMLLAQINILCSCPKSQPYPDGPASVPNYRLLSKRITVTV